MPDPLDLHTPHPSPPQSQMSSDRNLRRKPRALKWRISPPDHSSQTSKTLLSKPNRSPNMWVPQTFRCCWCFFFFVIQTHHRNVFLLFSVFWCFASLPLCGWWNVLDSGGGGWQGPGAVEWHGSEHVPRPCGWPGSGGCLATRRPRAGRTESQRMMDWLMWVPVGKHCCYFDLPLAWEVSTL